MAAVTPRFCWQNFAQFIGNTYTPSSEDSAAPHIYAIDQLRSKKWKTPLGWTIVTGFNDGIRIDEGVTGEATATIAAGTYATGALLATAIATALNAAATDNTWSCSYSSSTFKFTISHDNTQTGDILWTNAASTAAADLGYDDSADDTGATSYTADTVSYQSRHFITIKLTAAMTVTFGAVLDHNLSASGTVQLLGNSSNSWSSPGTTQTLADEDTARTYKSDFWSDQTYQWWRFVFSDVTNEVGFQEVGVLHFSSYFQPSIAHAVGWAVRRDELTDTMEADQGAMFQDLKARAEEFQLTFNGLTANDVSSFKTMQDNRRIGRPFFFYFDPQNTPSDGGYFHLSRPINRTHVPHELYSLQVAIKESLG